MKRIYFVTQSQNSRRGTGEEEETYFIKKKIEYKKLFNTKEIYIWSALNQIK